MAEVSLVVKATLVLALALCASRLLRGSSAAVRSLMLACTFGLLVLLPVASVTLPARAIEVPAAYSARFAAVFPLPVAPLAGSSFTTEARAASDVRFNWPSARTIVLLVWGAGVAGFAAPLLVGLFRLRRVRAHGRPWTHASLSSSVDLLLHDQVRVPITCGALRPLIALPIDAPQWSVSDLRRVLLHELEHVRRRDWLVHLGARAVCSLYWFHPLVWIAWRRLCLESERACDDAVLREGDGAEYAAQLVSLAKRITKHDALPLVSIVGRSSLATRVSAMLTANVARAPVGAAAAVAIASLAAVTALGIGPLQAVTALQRTTQSSGPSFESTSIRPSVPTERCQPPDCQVRYSADGRMSGSSVDLVDLIVSAYDLYRWQVVGAPYWAGGNVGVARPANEDRFDVRATARRSAGFDDFRPMLKTMLADRFRLVVRQETRTQKIYELAVEPAGHKLQRPGDRPYVASEDVWLRVNPDNMMATLRVDQLTMAQLARNMGGVLQTKVVDRTGLSGAYRVDVRWDANPNRPDVLQQPTSESPRDPQRPTVFEAFPAQLGLRLRQVSGAVEYLVVERVERPALDAAR